MMANTRMTPLIHTFSIAAYDSSGQAWGVAVASKFLAVGSVVPWARAGAGAVATQSFAKVPFGPDGLALMESGKSAREALDTLIAGDPLRAQRQVGLVDARGGSAAHTGGECYAWAGHRTGEGFACQGNILVGAETVDALADTFLATSGSLEERLMAALLAADSAGGDRRGKQSAAILVVKAGAGYGGDNDRYLDLRVDDHREPVRELRRILDMHSLFFGQANPKDQLPITEDLARELQSWLQSGGYLAREVTGIWDDESQKAFWALIGNENLESRWSLDGDTNAIDGIALRYLRERLGK
jgi:uncharacterized Ntn-hydrolase superfamily protein